MIKTEIQRISIEVDSIEAVYGFGSFFRSIAYNDIDILLVFGKQCQDCLDVYYKFKSSIDLLSSKIGIKFDLTPLTQSEFISHPLIENNSLILLYKGRSQLIEQRVGWVEATAETHHEQAMAYSKSKSVSKFFPTA